MTTVRPGPLYFIQQPDNRCFSFFNLFHERQQGADVRPASSPISEAAPSTVTARALQVESDKGRLNHRMAREKQRVVHIRSSSAFQNRSRFPRPDSGSPRTRHSRYGGVAQLSARAFR